MRSEAKGTENSEYAAAMLPVCRAFCGRGILCFNEYILERKLKKEEKYGDESSRDEHHCGKS